MLHGANCVDIYRESIRSIVLPLKLHGRIEIRWRYSRNGCNRYLRTRT